MKKVIVVVFTNQKSEPTKQMVENQFYLAYKVYVKDYKCFPYPKGMYYYESYNY